LAAQWLNSDWYDGSHHPGRRHNDLHAAQCVLGAIAGALIDPWIRRIVLLVAVGVIALLLLSVIGGFSPAILNLEANHKKEISPEEAL
jgi:hypothetical protein